MARWAQENGALVLPEPGRGLNGAVEAGVDRLDGVVLDLGVSAWEDVVHGCGILVDGEDLAAFAEQVDEVAAVAASGIDNGHAGLDVAAQDLIEDVDVDLAELFLDVDCHGTSVF